MTTNQQILHVVKNYFFDEKQECKWILTAHILLGDERVTPMWVDDQFRAGFSLLLNAQDPTMDVESLIDTFDENTPAEIGKLLLAIEAIIHNYADKQPLIEVQRDLLLLLQAISLNS